MANIPSYNQIDYNNDSLLVIDAKKKAIAKQEAAEKTQSATSKARETINQTTTQTKTQANKSIDSALTTATEKAKAVGSEKVADAKNKAADAKAQVDKAKDKAKSLKSALGGGGMSLIQNAVLGAVMGKLSGVPAMGVISKVAGVAAIVGGVSALTKTMKKAKLKRNDKNVNMIEQSKKDSADIKTDETLAGETGKEQTNAKVSTGETTESLASDTAKIQSQSETALTPKNSIPNLNKAVSTVKNAGNSVVNNIGSSVKNQMQRVTKLSDEVKSFSGTGVASSEFTNPIQINKSKQLSAKIASQNAAKKYYSQKYGENCQIVPVGTADYNESTGVWTQNYRAKYVLE